MVESDCEEVARTLAAVQALESSVRAGAAFYQQPQAQSQSQQVSQPQQVSPAASGSGSKGRRARRRIGRQPSELCPQLLQELQACQNNSQRFIEATQKVGSLMYMAPEVLTGGAGPWTLLAGWQKLVCWGIGYGCTRIKSGKLTPAGLLCTVSCSTRVCCPWAVCLTLPCCCCCVLLLSHHCASPSLCPAGRQYNEKIDVFSFGIILYELLTGVVLASRVAMQGQHEELLDYARQVANGHREAIPTHWPAQVRAAPLAHLGVMAWDPLGGHTTHAGLHLSFIAAVVLGAALTLGASCSAGFRCAVCTSPPPQVRALVSSCWAQDPRQRPTFKQVLKELYALKHAGVDVTMEGLRPRGDYNPVTDCGCSIM